MIVVNASRAGAAGRHSESKIGVLVGHQRYGVAGTPSEKLSPKLK
jgi:hypothetical protein